MIVPIAQSLRFRSKDNDYANFNNTLTADELFFNDSIYPYCQRWLTSDVVTVQIKADDATLPTAVLTKADKSTVNLTVTQVSAYDTDDNGSDDLFFFEFQIDMSLYATKSFVTVNQGSDTYESEPFFGDSDLQEELQDGRALQIQYFNIDNAFQIDFSTGIVYTLYIEGVLKKRSGGGEASVYDNQDELTLLKKTKKRLLQLQTDDIMPRFMGETLDLCLSMDNVVINGISYIFEDGSVEEEEVDGTNRINVTANLSDKEYLGVNTHDVGFDCDTPVSGEEIMVIKIDNASGSETFSVTGGFLIHTLTAEYVSGTTVEVKLGTTVGTDDLVHPFDLTASIVRAVAQIHADESDSDYDVYATVTGGVANLTLQLIKNKE